MPKYFKRPGENSQPHLIDQLRLPIGEPVELAVWAIKQRAIRCRVLPSQEPVTFRLVRDEVEGEIITVVPDKVWQYKQTVYMTGKVTGSRLDVAQLGLVPLKLEEREICDEEELQDIVSKDDPFMIWYQPILATGPRRAFEMEQIIPFSDPANWDEDPITQAVDAYESGDHAAAWQMVGELLAEDLRCIDGHAHLGNWEFNLYETPHARTENRARRHYQVGIQIAELSLANEFKGLLPWHHIDNRPYLRCLHGYGLCLWRAGETQAARAVFEKMLWLNPYDNQGARFLLADIAKGKTWYKSLAEDRR